MKKLMQNGTFKKNTAASFDSWQPLSLLFPSFPEPRCCLFSWGWLWCRPRPKHARPSSVTSTCVHRLCCPGRLTPTLAPSVVPRSKPWIMTASAAPSGSHPVSLLSASSLLSPLAMVVSSQSHSLIKSQAPLRITHLEQ